MRWKEELKNSIYTADQLCSALDLPETEIPGYDQIISRFPMMIPPYYLSLIDPSDPADPIARMCVPSNLELDPSGTFDTSGEGDNTKQEGLQHKYPQSVLILSTNVCAMYCRHCFRKRLVGLSDAELNKQVDAAVAYVRSHPEVTNVLVSGGDALMNPNYIIRRFLEELSDIDALDLIRIGSRIPVVLPMRIYEDEELLAIFRDCAARKALYLVTQFNHPREITMEAERAIQAVKDCGVQVRNQTVLLRGVNDKGQTLGLLLRRLTQIGVVPYYIFQCRPVTGVKGQFQVPLREGAQVVDAAKNLQNGIGKSVRYAMSHPRGKIEILGSLSDDEMLFKFHQNKYPEDAARIFTRQVSPDSTWLDEDLAAV